MRIYRQKGDLFGFSAKKAYICHVFYLDNHALNNTHNIRRWILGAAALLCFALAPSKAVAQFSSVSTNLVGWATGNINAAVDLKLDTRISFNIPLSFSPVMGKNIGWQNITFQPGARFWMTELYRGSFVGVYGSTAYYRLRNHGWNRRGWAAGAGVSYGYSHLLSKRWNLEVEVGVNVMYTDFDKTRNREFGVFEDEYWWDIRRVMILPGKLKVSFGYLF